MKREIKLVKKVKYLSRRLGMPRWLHHFGPKIYKFAHRFRALLVKFYTKDISYRQVKKLFDMLGMKCPSRSALQYTAKKLNAGFWQRVLKATSGDAYIIALDSTGFLRTNPSYHYLKRIDWKTPKVPVKLSVAFDTRKKKFCAAKIRVLPAHYIKDTKFLLQRTNAKVGVADNPHRDIWAFSLPKSLWRALP